MKLNKQTSTLTLEDKEIKLTNREYDLMRLLIDNKGNVVLRESIMAHVFDTYEVKDSSINALVFNLRKKFKEDLILTNGTRGYFIN
jgi:DNA-binding response OmpR family regulator